MEEHALTYLSDLRFVKPKLNEPFRSYAQTHHESQNTPDRPFESSSHARAGPRERIASDRLGEELEPQATIWQLYVEEAKEHDTEAVDSRNRNLDMMLIFVRVTPFICIIKWIQADSPPTKAALFSAILTAFLIESKDLLQNNMDDVSVELLLAIAQSQRRLEQGTPQSTSPIEISNFTPSMSSRWINGLWFTALVLSLSSALIAMLAKEWLNAFMSSLPRPAHAHALMHQKRLRKFDEWHVFGMIDFLPTMLHFSLLMFFLGLALYLWTLDSGVAIAQVIIVGTAATFYLATLLLGCLAEHSPFSTQASKSLSTVIQRFINRNRSLDSTPPNGSHDGDIYTTDDQLEALAWLVENTRDPEIVDCVCQALSGMRIKRGSSPDCLDESMASANLSSITSRRQGHFVELAIQHHVLLSTLFNAVRARLLGALHRLSPDSLENHGAQMAHYASAMAPLVYALETSGVSKSVKNRKADPRMRDAVFLSAVSAFEALDLVWSNDCPGLTPNAYALLTAADLRLLEAVTEVHHPTVYEVHSHRIAAVSASSEDEDVALEDDWEAIEMETIVSMADQMSLFQLQARYSRNLARSGYLLSHHNNYGLSIGSSPLVYLLESLRRTAKCNNLNPKTHLSTCLPQSKETSVLPVFEVLISGAGRSHQIHPLDVGDEDGLIAGLVCLIASSGSQDHTSLELAAGHTLANIGPMLLNQWVFMMNRNLETSSDRYAFDTSYLIRVLREWPYTPEADSDDMPYWTLHLLLSTALVAISLADCPEMAHLPNIACAALCRRAESLSGRRVIFDLCVFHADWLADLVELAEKHSGRLAQETLKCLSKLLLTEDMQGSLFKSRLIKWRRLPGILRFFSHLIDHPEIMQIVFADLEGLIEQEVEDPDIQTGYLRAFTETDEGFLVLISIIRELGDPTTGVSCIMRVIHNAAQRCKLPGGDDKILPKAVPGFLAATEVVLANIVMDSELEQRIRPFMENVSYLLESINPRLRPSVATNSILIAIQGLLKDVAANHDRLAGFVAILDQWIDKDVAG